MYRLDLAVTEFYELQPIEVAGLFSAIGTNVSIASLRCQRFGEILHQFANTSAKTIATGRTSSLSRHKFPAGGDLRLGKEATEKDQYRWPS